jgi:c(7)-type cytochrome triheme protein
MTSWKLIPILAATLLGGAALADNMPRLPKALKLTQSKDSPGLVTFNHDMHVDTAKPACVGCHPRHFSIVTQAAAKDRPAVTHARMEKGDACGACHGKTAFGFEDCTSCHAM